MTELLFEGYNAPSVVFGIDSLFSYNYNKGHTGLVVSSSHTATHLIPVVEGRGLVNLATRLNWGGAHSADYMLKLIQLKYPTFPAKLQGWHAEALMKDHCYVSGDYKEEVSNYLKHDVLEEKDRVVQFPFTEVVKVEKSQEELDRIAERRKESGRKLQEQAAKIRLEKVTIFSLDWLSSGWEEAWRLTRVAPHSSSKRNKSSNSSKTSNLARKPRTNATTNAC